MTKHITYLNLTIILALNILSAPTTLLHAMNMPSQAAENSVASKKQKPCSNGNCDKPSAQTCARCKQARYCSQNCQRAHWKTHKPTCTPPNSAVRRRSLSYAGQAAVSNAVVDLKPSHDTMRLPTRTELVDNMHDPKFLAILEDLPSLPCVNEQDEAGLTPLMNAAMYGRQNAVEFLLRKGADITLQDNQQFTALTSAIGTGQNAIVELLCQKDSELYDTHGPKHQSILYIPH